ncbi:MAG TPA: VOC family protein [Aldersonia sp.]
MPLDLYAGIPVADFPAAVAWYETLFGTAPDVADGTEAVWDLAEHRSVFIERAPDRAGNARHSIFVDDLDAWVAEVAGRGLVPVGREEYPNGVRKANFRDPDGNEIGFGDAPQLT